VAESVEKPAPENEPAPSNFSWGPLWAVAGALALIAGRVACGELQDGPVLRNGTPAKARVVDIRPTGSSWNDDQEMKLKLDVQPEGQEPYPAKVEVYLHPVHFPKYQPGALVDVRFDPKKRSHVVLVPP
jgi:hypothetical protein